MVTGYSYKLPKTELYVQVADTRHRFERSKYPLLNLVGDVGGFNSIIVLFAGHLMSLYAS